MKLGKFVTETLAKLFEAFGEYSLIWTAVFEWNSCLGELQGNQPPAK
jgi:hypothetical protein